jgi:hypothetical protein
MIPPQGNGVQETGDDDGDDDGDNNNSIQFNSYLFVCQLNRPGANYKVSTSE